MLCVVNQQAVIADDCRFVVSMLPTYCVLLSVLPPSRLQYHVCRSQSLEVCHATNLSLSQTFAGVLAAMTTCRQPLMPGKLRRCGGASKQAVSLQNPRSFVCFSPQAIHIYQAFCQALESPRRKEPRRFHKSLWLFQSAACADTTTTAAVQQCLSSGGECHQACGWCWLVCSSKGVRACRHGGRYSWHSLAGTVVHMVPEDHGASARLDGAAYLVH